MHEFLPLLGVAALLALAVSSFRLNRAAQPLRLEFAEKSQKLLANPRLPAHIGDFIRRLQAYVFGNRAMLIFGLFVIPVLAGAFLLFPKLIEGATRKFWIECPETRAQYDEVNRLHDRIMFFNNPILFFLVIFEAITFMAPAILLHGIFRGATSMRVNTDVALNLIEEKMMKLSGLFPRLGFAQ